MKRKVNGTLTSLVKSSKIILILQVHHWLYCTWNPLCWNASRERALHGQQTRGSLFPDTSRWQHLHAWTRLPRPWVLLWPRGTSFPKSGPVLLQISQPHLHIPTCDPKKRENWPGSLQGGSTRHRVERMCCYHLRGWPWKRDFSCAPNPPSGPPARVWERKTLGIKHSFPSLRPKT